jgi:hypothetical protein
MNRYDGSSFDPPAPLARVTLRDSSTGTRAFDVPLLMDTGADVTLLPRAAVEGMGVLATDDRYELIAFDGTQSFAPVVALEVIFLARCFRSRYLLIEGDHGI